MREEDKIQLIEDYINGQLSEQEKADFQQQIQQDPLLAQEVDLYRNIFSGIALGGRRELKQHFKSVEDTLAVAPFQQVPGEKAPRKETGEPIAKAVKPMWQKNAWIIGLAACLVLGLFAMLWLTRSKSPEELFTQYYSPYQNVVNSIERGETIQDAKKTAMQAYENQDYERAAQGLQQILRTTPDERELNLYLGISYIETNQLDSAKIYLKKAAADTTINLHTQGRWFLALAHLKSNEKDQAKAQLQILSRGNDTYAVKAAKLLDEL